MNKAKFDALPPEYKEIVMATARETQDWAGSLYSQVSEALMASLKKAGMTIIEADEAAFRKAVEPVYAKHGERFAALLQTIRDIEIARVDPDLAIRGTSGMQAGVRVRCRRATHVYLQKRTEAMMHARGAFVAEPRIPVRGLLVSSSPSSSPTSSDATSSTRRCTGATRSRSSFSSGCPISALSRR